jgi:prolyl oligopeptidase
MTHVNISSIRFQPTTPLASKEATAQQAPATEQRPVVDNYHGREVVDKFRWLEDGTAQEVKDWTKAQNAHTQSHLQNVPERAQVVERLAELFSGKNAEKPYSVGGREFVYKREGGQNQAALYQKNEAGEFEVVLDPNSWSDKGTEALDWMYHSPNGRYLAYGRSSGGDEWSRLHVLDLTNGTETGEVIPRTRAASLAWEPDEGGFYYTKYPEPGSVPEGEENYHRHIFHHRLGDDPTADPKVYGEGIPREAWTSVQLSENGEKLLFTVSQGWTRDDLIVQDVKTGEQTVLMSGVEAKSEAEFVENGSKIQVLTTLDAPRKRLLEIDLATPGQDDWKELLPQDPEATLQSVTRTEGKVYANYLRDAHSEISVFSTGSDQTLQSEGKVELPGIGSVSGMTKTENGKLEFTYTSYNYPHAVMELDPAKSKPEVVAQNEVPFDFENYDVKQEFFRSVDGTKVPMFIVHKKGMEPNGETPTLLYGYGGFDVSLTPGFSKSTAHWLEQGGIYAVATLRGGGEYGAEWHEGGMLEKKQNVFDDFISAGQHLITKGYTNPDKLAVAGGSNGGLLTGAALTQAPELMEAAVVAVPLLDMVRYDEFGIAKLWRAEYGSSTNEGQFEYIRDYSPYQNVKSKLARLGQPYPATLLMAGEKDSRTDPLHARKMTAELQLAQGADQATSPILLRVEANAGHGAGKPIGKVVEAEADKWIFLQQQLGMLSDGQTVENSDKQS